jgi:Arc/MetJ family transcription regulator
MARVRTNIEIEDAYVQEIMRRYHLRTKTEAVDMALRRMAAEAMTLEEALAMRGSHSIGEIPPEPPPHGVEDT